MPRKGNIKNLVPQSQRTPEEAREMGRKGGIASGKARREKKRMSEIYAGVLEGRYSVAIDGETKIIDGEKLLQTIARDILMRRDSSSVSMMREIREATEGAKVALSGGLEIIINQTGVSGEAKDLGTITRRDEDE